MKFSELNALSEGLVKTAKVSAYQQKTEWSCSAATLKAALMHHGFDFSEEELIKAIGARKGRGAETTDIMNGAKKLGFDAYEGSFKSLDEAKETLKKGIPIIADVQSFNYPGKGHYIVIAGYKPGKGFIIMDPNTKGKTAVDNWRLLSAEELEEKWWDRAMAPPHELMPKWGVMVKPKSKEKTANGDMMAYLSAHPKKLREYNERQAAKKKKTASGDILGMNAKRRAKAESASAHPSFGKFAEAAFFDELVKIANMDTTLGSLVLGAQAGGLIGGARKAMDPNPEPGKIGRVVKGIATGAVVGALLALGMQRNAVGKNTLGKL